MQEEKNYLRKTYRLKIPAKVYIGDKEYNVLDWSFLGFRVEKKLFFEFPVGREYVVDFELPFASFKTRFKAKAVVRWSSKEEAGFEFTEISDEAKLLMKDYVEAYIEGRLVDAEGVLTVAEGVELPVEVEPQITEEEKERLDRKLKRALVIVFFVVVFAGFLGYLIYKNMPVVYSAQAFVSGKNINVLAPEDGVISRMYVGAGEFVNKGDKLFSIKNDSIDDEILSLKLSYEEKKSLIKALKRKLSNLKKTSDIYTQSKIRKLKTQIKLLKKELRIKERNLENLKKAYDMYLIKREEVEKASMEVERLKAEIESLQQELSALENLKSPLDSVGLKLIEQINKLSIEMESIKSKIQALNKLKTNLTVYAPKEGYVSSINKKEGELVKKFSPVLVLDIPSNEVYVIARFKYHDALKIKVGDKAEVLVPSLKKVYKGKVVSIGKTSISSDSIVSETEAYALKDVPVRIKIYTNDKNLFTGMYAEARVVTESRYVFIVDFLSRLLGR